MWDLINRQVTISDSGHTTINEPHIGDVFWICVAPFVSDVLVMMQHLTHSVFVLGAAYHLFVRGVAYLCLFVRVIIQHSTRTTNQLQICRGPADPTMTSDLGP